MDPAFFAARPKKGPERRTAALLVPPAVLPADLRRDVRVTIGDSIARAATDRSNSPVIDGPYDAPCCSNAEQQAALVEQRGGSDALLAKVQRIGESCLAILMLRDSQSGTILRGESEHASCDENGLARVFSELTKRVLEAGTEEGGEPR